MPDDPFYFVENEALRLLEITFPGGKPPAAAIRLMRTAGFRWAGPRKAWARVLTDHARAAADDLRPRLAAVMAGETFGPGAQEEALAALRTIVAALEAVARCDAWPDARDALRASLQITHAVMGANASPSPAKAPPAAAPNEKTCPQCGKKFRGPSLLCSDACSKIFDAI